MNCKFVLFVLLVALVWDPKAGAAELRRITLGYSSIGPMATGFWILCGNQAAGEDSH
ncbi:MAG: hypothetical protein HYS66_08695 [Deltaproteobacteria bacterium]|nr:hypothetical protein [Deltaproteobacteria bacterium]